MRDIIFEAILSPSVHYENIQDNPAYNSVLPLRIILKIFVVNMLGEIKRQSEVRNSLVTKLSYETL